MTSRDKSSDGFPIDGRTLRKRCRIENPKSTLGFRPLKRKKKEAAGLFQALQGEEKGWCPWPSEILCKAGISQVLGKSLTRSESSYWFGKSKTFESAIKHQPRLPLSYCKVLNTRERSLNRTASKTHFKLNGGDFIWWTPSDVKRGKISRMMGMVHGFPLE